MSDFFGIQPLAGEDKLRHYKQSFTDKIAGGDKPRHYNRSFTDKVGAGFILARKLVCIDDDCRRKIAQSWLKLTQFFTIPLFRDFNTMILVGFNQ